MGVGSKWESNTTSPDINQLPTLASIFGITIDELFVRNFLIGEIQKNPKNYRAYSILGDLYHFHACRLNDKAIHYAYEALLLQPDNKFDLNTLSNASNGHISDWNIGCHYKLIERLKKLTKESEENE